MLSLQEHLDNLTRHINLVRDACLLLGKRLIERGRPDFGRLLIQRGFCHDVSKFSGMEWKFLHAGKDVPWPVLEPVVQQHAETNDHHPEAWGGIENMPEIAVAEMVCDWYARSQEMGTGLRDWVIKEATPRFKIERSMSQWDWIQECLDILIENHFVKRP